MSSIMTLGQKRWGFPFCVFSIVEDSVPSQLTALITMLLVQGGAIYIPGSRMERVGIRRDKQQAQTVS